MLRTLFSFRGLILVFGLVAVGLPIALVQQLGIVRTLNSINADVARIRQAQLALAGVLQLQVDEESAIRGYAATRQRTFLEPYDNARDAMRTRLDLLQTRLMEEDPAGDEARAVNELREVNAQWLREVGAPVARGAPLSEERAVQGKLLTDRIRSDVLPIQRSLDQRYETAIVLRDATIRTASASAIAAIAVIGIEIVFFGVVIARLRRRLDRDRGVVESLQIAASAQLVPPAHLALGTVYRSATRGARVGGDVYDIYRLDDDRTLIVVGDVSGKGLTAAIDTTFVRYAVRAFASDVREPSEIVRRFDDLYRGGNTPPEAFVTLFVGVHDRRDGSLAYANAGHEAAWIRRGSTLTMLAPTGPIVGLGGFAFDCARAALAPGEMLILGTDGLTEARTPDGAFVPLGEVERWLLAADPGDPQRFVDTILADATRFARGRITDDLAIVAVVPRP